MDQQSKMPIKNRVVPTTTQTRWCVALICVVFGVSSLVGIRWGLPGRHLDATLFGADPPWSGKRILELAGGVGKFSPTIGADVDVDPLGQSTTSTPRDLTANEADIARIYLRYRLYTHQPDEMITMMSLAGMNPRQIQFDPRLYQYGGLFIYPVGALIAAADLVGMIDVRSDIEFYLDHPDEFAKFYIVARMYSAMWGILGVVVVAAIARRLGGNFAALLAALLYTLLPVVVCMSHEAKPHLPGAVLMLIGVYYAMRHLSRELYESHANWWKMCACCGAAVGMVLSSAPIVFLVPLIDFLERLRVRNHRAQSGSIQSVPRPLGSGSFKPQQCDIEHANPPGLSGSSSLKRCISGLALCVGVYLISNPYIVINGFSNRDVLRSNFGNSLAMYQVSRCFEGFIRVLELTIEGAGLLVVAVGCLALVFAIRRRMLSVIPLAATGILLILQFVLIGAGKPAEYGRFGVFPISVLAIGVACYVAQLFGGHTESSVSEFGGGTQEYHLNMERKTLRFRWLANSLFLLGITMVLFVGSFRYLSAFVKDVGQRNSRIRLAESLGAVCSTKTSRDQQSCEIAVPREPAPYCCPPLNFARTRVVLEPSVERFMKSPERGPGIWIQPVDVNGVTDWTPADDRVKPTESMSPGTSGTYPLARSIARILFGLEPMISWADKPFEVKTRSVERK